MIENKEQGELLPQGRQIGTQSAYAKHRGCRPSAVHKALKERRITGFLVAGKLMLDFAACDAAWAISTRPRADAPGPPPPRGPYQAPDQTEAQDALAAARLRREQAAGELLALRVDREAGLLVELAEVDRVLADLGTTLRVALQDLPHRLAGELVGQPLDEVRRTLTEAMDRTLNDICDKMRAFADGVPEQGTLLPLAPTDPELDAYPPFPTEETAP